METLSKRPHELDELCFENESCLNEVCQKKIVDRHDLKTQAVFESMVLAFHKPMPGPKEYTRPEVENIMATLDCTAGDFIEFSGDDSLYSNGDIKLKGMNLGVRGKYSIAFFKGVIIKFGVDSTDLFLFYKAIDPITLRVTLAMKYNAGGRDVYFADLVGLYP